MECRGACLSSGGYKALRLGGLRDKHLCLAVLEAGKSQVGVLGDSTCSEGSPLSCHPVGLLCLAMDLTGPLFSVYELKEERWGKGEREIYFSHKRTCVLSVKGQANTGRGGYCWSPCEALQSGWGWA